MYSGSLTKGRSSSCFNRPSPLEVVSSLQFDLRKLRDLGLQSIWFCLGFKNLSLVDKFGYQKLDESMIDRVERLTSRQADVFLRHGVFFTHRDFNKILDTYERGDKFYLYTGRGPSSEALHLGHLIVNFFSAKMVPSFMLKLGCRYLQEAFKVPLVIQITDDEKCVEEIKGD